MVTLKNEVVAARPEAALAFGGEEERRTLVRPKFETEYRGRVRGTIKQLLESVWRTGQQDQVISIG